MEIRINNQPIDITLEGERTVNEVVAGVKRWLHDSQFTVTDVTVDDEQLPLDDSESHQNRHRDISGVDRIEFQALSREEVAASSLATLRDYFAFLQESITSGDQEEYQSLKQEYPEVREALQRHLPDALPERESSEGRQDGAQHRNGTQKVDGAQAADGSVSAEQPGVDQLLEAGDELPEGAFRERLLPSLEQAKNLAEARLREVVAPQEELENTASVIERMLPQVSDVSVMLQTGQQSEAMSIVARFVELVSKVTRLLSTEQQESCARQVEELNGILQELVEAFQSQDTVLIGDLLEYETVPRIQEILSTALGKNVTSESEE